MILNSYKYNFVFINIKHQPNFIFGVLHIFDKTVKMLPDNIIIQHNTAFYNQIARQKCTIETHSFYFGFGQVHCIILSCCGSVLHVKLARISNLVIKVLGIYQQKNPPRGTIDHRQLTWLYNII